MTLSSWMKAYQDNYWVRALIDLRKSRLALIGGCVLIIMIFTAIFAPYIAPYDPNLIGPNTLLLSPSWSHLFGTDELGRDILSRVIWGARISLYVGLGSVAIAASVGLLMGSIAGYFAGFTDELIERIIDALISFPALILALLVYAILGQSINNLIFTLGVVFAPRFARVARGSIVVETQKTYVEAARAVGYPSFRIILMEILPNASAPLIVNATITMAFAIISEASLSFLGLGVPPPTASWGSMLDEGYPYIQTAPWIILFPGLALLLTLLALNLFGDGLRDVLDPRLRTG